VADAQQTGVAFGQSLGPSHSMGIVVLGHRVVSGSSQDDSPFGA
jgi:hypothetical protein